MPGPAPLTGRLAVLAGGLAFWIPLLICTWLALVPEPPDNPVFRLSDVILHGAAFTYLTFAFVLSRLVGANSSPGTSAPGLNRMLALQALAAMLGYGLFLELAQSFVPERSPELKDLLVDLVGIAVGLLLAWLLARPLASLTHYLAGRLVGLVSR